MNDIFILWSIQKINFDVAAKTLTVNWKCNAWNNPNTYLNDLDNTGFYKADSITFECFDFPAEDADSVNVLNMCWNNGINKLQIENDLKAKFNSSDF